MAFKVIQYRGKPLTIHKAVARPDFNSKTVLVQDKWDYVEMWLKRNHPKNTTAQTYWNQAKYFHLASMQLPKTSSPLTSYYCFLNATKTLLSINKIEFSDRHGVDGDCVANKASLVNEEITFKPGGVLAGLCAYFGESSNNDKYHLKLLFYHLPFVHRSYCLTFKAERELFIPIKAPIFVRKDNSTESWFCAELTTNHANNNTIKRLPQGYERDMGCSDKFIVRRTNRFEWKRGQEKGNIERLNNYHKTTRAVIKYIYGDTRLWYLKGKVSTDKDINRNSTTLIYACMHRLSELARYSPDLFSRHFEGKHNWLLSEFIALAPNQFIDRIASEITGQEFLIPGVR